MTPLESELMKFVKKWRKERDWLKDNCMPGPLVTGKTGAISDMLTELELILKLTRMEND